MPKKTGKSSTRGGEGTTRLASWPVDFVNLYPQVSMKHQAVHMISSVASSLFGSVRVSALYSGVTHFFVNLPRLFVGTKWYFPLICQAFVITVILFLGRFIKKRWKDQIKTSRKNIMVSKKRITCPKQVSVFHFGNLGFPMLFMPLLYDSSVSRYFGPTFDTWLFTTGRPSCREKTIPNSGRRLQLSS